MSILKKYFGCGKEQIRSYSAPWRCAIGAEWSQGEFRFPRLVLHSSLSDGGNAGFGKKRLEDKPLHLKRIEPAKEFAR